MPEELFVLVALFGFGTFTLIGMRMWLTARIQSRRQLPQEAFERLAESVDRLHEDMRLVRDEVTELQERVDFAERVLTRGDPSGSLRQGKSAPH
jgi:hypothetical protein